MTNTVFDIYHLNMVHIITLIDMKIIIVLLIVNTNNEYILKLLSK